MDRPIYTLPFPRNVVCSLMKLNVTCCKDITPSSINEIETVLHNTKFGDIWFQTSSASVVTKSALQCLEEENKDDVTSFSKEIDDLLGGGFKAQKLTELVGPPGSGKTQLCLQLCVAAKVPKLLGGLEAGCMFIDINNNYSQKRINEMHLSSVRHCNKLAKRLSLSDCERSSLQKYAQSTPCSDLHRYIVNDVIELKSRLYYIQSALLCEEFSNVKLIVIDSFVSAFFGVTPSLQRTRVLSTVMNQLRNIAVKFNIAIVLTNSLVTRYKNDDEFEIVPHLGETFAHLVHKRVMLNRSDNYGEYTATLLKSSEDKPRIANFKVINDGIRDINFKSALEN